MMNIRQYILERSTAIPRTKPSYPARKIVQLGVLKKPVLDYGCGYGLDADTFHWDKYDIEHFPKPPSKQYKTIVCNYVLNTIPKASEKRFLTDLRRHLTDEGTAYIAVRRDKFKEGPTAHGNFQRMVYLDLPILFQDSKCCIYILKRGYYFEAEERV